MSTSFRRVRATEGPGLLTIQDCVRSGPESTPGRRGAVAGARSSTEGYNAGRRGVEICNVRAPIRRQSPGRNPHRGYPSRFRGFRTAPEPGCRAATRSVGGPGSRRANPGVRLRSQSASRLCADRRRGGSARPCGLAPPRRPNRPGRGGERTRAPAPERTRAAAPGTNPSPGAGRTPSRGARSRLTAALNEDERPPLWQPLRSRASRTPRAGAPTPNRLTTGSSRTPRAGLRVLRIRGRGRASGG